MIPSQPVSHSPAMWVDISIMSDGTGSALIAGMMMMILMMLRGASYRLEWGSPTFLNKGPVYRPSDFRRPRLWPVGVENVLG